MVILIPLFGSPLGRLTLPVSTKAWVGILISTLEMGGISYKSYLVTIVIRITRGKGGLNSFS